MCKMYFFFKCKDLEFPGILLRRGGKGAHRREEGLIKEMIEWGIEKEHAWGKELNQRNFNKKGKKQTQEEPSPVGKG